MKNTCEIVRRELDELMLEDTCSASALAHLEGCNDCREFQEKQTKLRQMVGSLGTVAAPADFDFRLRARLANESNGGAFHLNSFSWLLARRGFALAAALLLFIATGVVVVRNLTNRPEQVEMADTNKPAVNPPQTIPAPVPKPSEEVNPAPTVAAAGDNQSPKASKQERVGQPGSRPRRHMVAEDFSSRRPDVFSPTRTVSSAESFSIDASSESFKVSLDDGRGNARTISLPMIRFGSQRMLPTGNPYAAKGVW